MRLTKNAAIELAHLSKSCNLNGVEVVAILAIASLNASCNDMNDNNPPIRKRDIAYGIEIVRREWQKQGA